MSRIRPISFRIMKHLVALSLLAIASLLILWNPIISNISQLFPPPPGWKSLVTHALLDKASFPKGWVYEYDIPANQFSDPEINHVSRFWTHPSGGVGIETIWRSYSRVQALDRYLELVFQQLLFRKDAKDTYVVFARPEEIKFKSKSAQFSYLVCGWYKKSYCNYFAIYQNYTLILIVDHEDQFNGVQSPGLSYQQIEEIIMAIDVKMVNYLKNIASIK